MSVKQPARPAAPKHKSGDNLAMSNVHSGTAPLPSSTNPGASCALKRLRRGRRRRGGRRGGAVVLRDQAAQARYRGLDVFLSRRAQLFVGLLRRLVLGPGGALVADREQRI